MNQQVKKKNMVISNSNTQSIKQPDTQKPVVANTKPIDAITKPIPTPSISTNSGINNSLNNNAGNKKGMPPAKKSLFSRIKNQSKSSYNDFKSKLASPIELALDVDSTGMVPITQYKNELLARETEKQSGDLPASLSPSIDTNDFELPAIDLDEYLKGRYAIKAEEFKRLQQEQGFYFSDTLDSQILERARLNEGMFLMGVNINSLVDLYKHVVFKEPLLDENGNPINIPGEGDILASGRAYDLLGEAYNENYDKIYRDKMGFRLGPHRQLRPELVLLNDTPFDDIIRESAKYTGASYERISPKSLLNMIRVLDEYSKYELQWLRSATAIEIIYKYLSNGMSRQMFFTSESKLTEESLLELEEFFKTDNIFMTLDELREFKNDLNFYRSDEHRKLIDEKEKKKKIVPDQNKNNRVSTVAKNSLSANAKIT
jgi:hypothetical protein